MRAPALAVVAIVALLSAGSSASAQTFPVVPGAIELQVGIAGVTLPEGTNGTWSMQPLARAGTFLAEGLQVQLEAGVRVWPLGIQAPSSYNVGGNLVWFPNLGPQNRNLYLLAGVAALSSDPPGPAGSQWDGLGRGGLGVKVPLDGLGFLSDWHLSIEYRAEIVVADEKDLTSGVAFGFSYFL